MSFETYKILSLAKRQKNKKNHVSGIGGASNHSRCVCFCCKKPPNLYIPVTNYRKPSLFALRHGNGSMSRLTAQKSRNSRFSAHFRQKKERGVCDESKMFQKLATKKVFFQQKDKKQKKILRTGSWTPEGLRFLAKSRWIIPGDTLSTSICVNAEVLDIAGRTCGNMIWILNTWTQKLHIHMFLRWS